MTDMFCDCVTRKKLFCWEIVFAICCACRSGSCSFYMKLVCINLELDETRYDFWLVQIRMWFGIVRILPCSTPESSHERTFSTGIIRMLCNVCVYPCAITRLVGNTVHRNIIFPSGPRVRAEMNVWQMCSVHVRWLISATGLLFIQPQDKDVHRVMSRFIQSQFDKQTIIWQTGFGIHRKIGERGPQPWFEQRNITEENTIRWD